MKSNILAKRYANALFTLSLESNRQDKILDELRALKQSFLSSKEITEFFLSPLISGEKKEQSLAKALSNNGMSDEVRQFLLLLAKKDRIGIFSETVDAFEDAIDNQNKVCRGNVRSTLALGPAERAKIEDTVERVLKKKVIMTYKIDPSVIGGLVAQVGSFTFDDSLSTHLKRMTEELKRSTI